MDEEVKLTSFELSIGGYFGGYSSISIYSTLANDLIVSYRAPHSYGEVPQIIVKTNDRFMHELYDLIIEPFTVLAWEEEYRNPYILDGTQWEIKVTIDAGDFKSVYGDNEFPEGFNELLIIFKKMVKLEFDIDFGEKKDQ